ncbi:hypothetical protein [Lysinibacillus mangiferihumi]|uniref:hypothetical protein n=1 Tax=Lysinibacillus mangiferihumi TaxID=1130819 RepID=UPI001F313224|nr:hypothetical protein [Lysinibacillus mangiferihumi]
MAGNNSKFWTNIKIKVNTSVKEAATEKELALLLLPLGKSTMGVEYEKHYSIFMNNV